MGIAKRKDVLLLVVFVGALLFRLINLGYSDFLQDEVGAQNYLFDDQSFINFLLSRSIGPGEFIISYLLNLLFYANHPEFFVRLPFSLASIATIPSVYILVKRFINRDAGLIASLVFTLSGLLIAFSKIVQYQSILILLLIWALYFLGVYLDTTKHKKLFYAGILSGLALLFHYDALSFILPFIIFLTLKRDVKGILYYVLPVVILSLVFYIPYVLYPTFPETFNYLLDKRIDSNFKFDAIYHSARLLFFYHSKEFVVIVLLGIFASLFKLTKHLDKSGFILLALALTFSCIRLITPENNDLFRYISAFTFMSFIFIWALDTYKNNRFNLINFIYLWFMFAYLTYGLLFTKPLTHIYTFLIPGFILFGYFLSGYVKKYIGLVLALLLVLTISSISFNYKAFIETNDKFPWENEKYIFGSMLLGGESMTEIAKSLGIGFGFPYNRSWNEIAQLTEKIKNEQNIANYTTNERYRIAKYHMQHLKYSEEYPDIYVYINNPYSLDYEENISGTVLVTGEDFIIYDLK